ncbi:hypothetical protein H0H87_004795 [Tephrocybe sp. NHM501043]|nr:hypothetical protein H0H87_004795 [Tephrocybe sp. NHM501043]
MASAGRRTTSTRTAINSSRTAGISIDKLSEQLTSGLVISDTKGKRKTANVSYEQLRLESMRAVNSASQALTLAIQSGWKKSTGKPSSSVVNAAAATIKHLTLLRQNGSGDVDVERAAMSVLGKLVSLELYDEAQTALAALHVRLCALLKVSSASSSSRYCLICIPLPTSETINPILLTLTTTYLAYSLTILTNVSYPTSRNSKYTTIPLDSLADALSSKEMTLLTWIPRCSTIPAKQLDSLLTRTYTALTKACMSWKSNSRAVFSVRMYAVTCLALTSPGTVEPSTFWDQVVRFGGACVKSQEFGEDETMRTVLTAFSNIVRVIEERNGANLLLSGNSFVGFCEYWLAFAKKAGDICLVDRIANLIQGISMASSSSPSMASQESPLQSNEELALSKANLERDSLETARLCAALTQTTSALEQKSPDMESRVRETISILKRSTAIIRLLHTPDNDPDYARISGKVDRALERTRRAAISIIESPEKFSYDLFCTLLEELSNVLTQQCSFPNADANIFTRCFDTLFILARTRLILSDPRTYIPAHHLLTNATSLLNPRVNDPTIDAPNYMRCISGAFHNLAGTMYQAGRYGSAVGFLKDACSLGVRALENRRQVSTSTEGKEGKAEEGWRQLEEQLYRRWELLGVCFLKNGDRKDAVTTGSTTIFEVSNDMKQLATIVDRVTTLGACELLLEPSAVSLISLDLNDAAVTGVLLERQAECLESMRWKEGIPTIISHLLGDAVNVYGPRMPVRRARVLLKCLELMYHSGPNTKPAIDSPEDIGVEIEQLLHGNLNQDIGLVPYVYQYRAVAHLWQAVHAHRRMDSRQSELVALHVDAACRNIKSMFGTPSDPESVKKPLPKQIVVPKEKTYGPPTRQRPARKAAVSREPVTPKPKSRKVLQPVSMNIQTPPRQAESIKILLGPDDIEKLVTLIELAARISGILGQILPKIHLLDASRKLCESQLGKKSDGYIKSSVDLAYEYAKLGKMRRATGIFGRILDVVRTAGASTEAAAYFFLRYAESEVVTSDDAQRSASIYSEALDVSGALDIEDKGLPTLQRVRARVKRLEMAAIASHVFALIQYSKEDVPAALESMLQALRLWNRASDSLLRLSSPRSSSLAPQDDNPFGMSNLKDALPAVHSKDALSKELSAPKKSFSRRTSMDGLEWRITEGLVATLFSIIEVYVKRGSVREAEYFVQQAQDLAESLNAPILVSRALAKKGEIHLHQGHLETSLECLTTATTLLEKTPGVERIDVRRLHGLYKERVAHIGEATALYEESLSMIGDLDESFRQLDSIYGSSEMEIPRTTLPFLTGSCLFPHDILVTLEAAERLFWDNLTDIAKTGNISDVREGAVSLALVQAFQTSLGKSTGNTSSLTVSLLDASAAITLRREMLETLRHKFPQGAGDDLQWPLITADGSARDKQRTSCFSFDSPLQSDDNGEEVNSYAASLKEYWAFVQARYQARIFDPSALSLGQVINLPYNWTVIHISATEDKSALFIARQECGPSARTPLIFCVPLNGRRDTGDSEDGENRLTFEDAVEELKEIVRLSDEGTKTAINIKPEDQEARAAWWKERAALDVRLRELLVNVEFCWLGAFKTILSPRPNLTPELIDDLRVQFEKVFHQGLHVQDKKKRTVAYTKSASQTRNSSASEVTFDDGFLECFSTLSPKCRDEELEDLVYFILDLYQFHGVPVAIAEVDILRVTLDLRAVLEDHAQKCSRQRTRRTADEHIFLVLDKNLQGLPWESIPILRGRSVSRIPSVDFLHDRVLFADLKRKRAKIAPSKGAVVDPRKGFYILNPSGDLGKTEARFKEWAHDMEKAGWEGISGHAPSEQQFLNALRSRDLVVYFGHGGGEQYVRSHKIRNLPECAATMLWGCSSGALREMGDFDRVGTPYNYMLAGSPCLVANLWDVTDRDIDKFSQSVFDRIGLTAAGVEKWGRKEGQISIVDAVGQSRDSCKLKYLTGAAPVVYGIPFYM